MNLDYYKKALTLIDGQVNDDGFVVSNGDETVYFKVKKRKLVLPTEELLKESNWKENIPFHPLCETSISNKRSPILDKFIELANFNLDIRLRNLISEITRKLSLGETLPPDAMELMAAVCPEITKKTHEDAVKIFTAPITAGTIPKAAERVLTVSLTRNAENEGKRYKAVSKVTCMPYDSEEADTHFFGHKCTSKKSAKSIKGILDTVVGGLDSLDVYTTATNITTAPLWNAYTKTMGKIHTHLNTLIALFEMEDLFEAVDPSFIEMNKEANQIKLLIPSMADSRGEYVEKDSDEPAAPTANSSTETSRHQTSTAGKQPSLMSMSGRTPDVAPSLFGQSHNSYQTQQPTNSGSLMSQLSVAESHGYSGRVANQNNGQRSRQRGSSMVNQSSFQMRPIDRGIL